IAKTLSVQNFEKIKWRDDLKILVAEDDPINQRVLSKLLLKINLKVKMVDNGYKVLEELDSTLYDLIFMDVQMPLMDGITTTKEIRKKFSLQSPIIIALTANAMKEDQQICLGAGMNDFLTKPYFIEDLQRILLKWIGDESRT
ncbi:MAG TPA: response regulator, partial [Leptospiraceae bacterium]|nr:response regulator [Leptospiraceae bacterium]